MSSRARNFWLAIALVMMVGVVIAIVVLRQPENSQSAAAPQSGAPAITLSPAGPSIGNVNLLLGNPSDATKDPKNKDNYLLVKKYFALSYNESKGIPNWVSWRVTRADLGSAPRRHEFVPDYDTPGTFYRVTSQDYIGSGFDRGHMCPHSDRAASVDMSYATFVMTNIIPQSKHVNEKAWAHLEEYCRDLVMSGERLYIIAGPEGTGGTGTNGFAEHCGDGRVTVPAFCWKVIVVVDENGSDDDLAKINSSTRVISVIMPNDDTKVGNGWLGFRTSTGEIERRTHLHFFDRCNSAIANALRQKVDSAPLDAQRIGGHTGTRVPSR